MSATTAIRWSTFIVVAAVAAVAGWISYLHAVDVVRLYQHGPVIYAYPVLTDGLVYSSSMALLSYARRGVPAERLAYWLLGLGVFATLAANVWSGYRGGVPGAIIAAWPAAALVGSYEMLMRIMRGQAAEQAAPAASPAVPKASFGGVVAVQTKEQQAEERFAGRVPSIREIKRELNVGSERAPAIQAHLRSKLAA